MSCEIRDSYAFCMTNGWAFMILSTSFRVFPYSFRSLTYILGRMSQRKLAIKAYIFTFSIMFRKIERDCLASHLNTASERSNIFPDHFKNKDSSKSSSLMRRLSRMSESFSSESDISLAKDSLPSVSSQISVLYRLRSVSMMSVSRFGYRFSQTFSVHISQKSRISTFS